MCRNSLFADIPSSEIDRLINEWIHDQKARTVVKRRLLDNVTYERIAEENNLSVRHTKTIVYNAQDRLLSIIARNPHT